MLKKLLLFFIALLLISSTFVDSVQAQGGPADSSQIWRCLKAEQVGGKSKKPPKEAQIHLTGSGFPAGYDIYIVLSAPPKSQKDKAPDQTKTVQSTGNAEFDRLIFGSDYTAKIAKLGLSFQVPEGANSNQKLQSTDGSLDFNVKLGNANGHVNYAFFAVTINEPITTAPTQVNQESGNTLQYGTFNFEQRNNGDPEKCVSIRWDPYGRVFDSQSLEPIPKVKVRLLDENQEVYRGVDVALTNPQTTEEDGVFNFPVEPGTYYLTIQNQPSTHTFIASPNLHQNYAKAYTNIYKPGEPIIEEAGQPEQRDIPLDPGLNQPTRNPPKIMSFDSVKVGDIIKYEGYVSHPLSMVRLVGVKTGTEYAKVTSDEFGAWQIILSRSKIPQNEKLQLIPKKVSIQNLSYVDKIWNKLSALFIGEVKAQELVVDEEGQGVTLDPILSHLEGYAYDATGQKISNATIRVKIDWSNQTYYQTKADKDGFFKIEQKNLPIFSYHLEFFSPSTSSTTSMTTSDFAERNKDYLASNNINLMSATKNGQALYPTFPPPTSIPQEPTPLVTNQNATMNQMNLILTMVTLVILLGVAGGVLLYIKKKEMPSQEGPI